MKAVILFAHGARDPRWAAPVHAIAEVMRQRDATAAVACAFLEFIEPALPQAVDALVAAGCHEIVIVPLFMAQSGHTRRDLPDLLEQLRVRHPAVQLRVAAAIGEAPAVVAAIAEYALTA